MLLPFHSALFLNFRKKVDYKNWCYTDLFIQLENVVHYSMRKTFKEFVDINFQILNMSLINWKQTIFFGIINLNMSLCSFVNPINSKVHSYWHPESILGVFVLMADYVLQLYCCCQIFQRAVKDGSFFVCTSSPWNMNIVLLFVYLSLGIQFSWI